MVDGIVRRSELTLEYCERVLDKIDFNHIVKAVMKNNLEDLNKVLACFRNAANIVDVYKDKIKALEGKKEFTGKKGVKLTEEQKNEVRGYFLDFGEPSALLLYIMKEVEKEYERIGMYYGVDRTRRIQQVATASPSVTTSPSVALEFVEDVVEVMTTFTTNIGVRNGLYTNDEVKKEERINIIDLEIQTAEVAMSFLASFVHGMTNHIVEMQDNEVKKTETREKEISKKMYKK